MNKRFYLNALILFFVSVLIFSCDSKHLQNKEESSLPIWIDMMEEESVDLDMARQTFDEYWKSRKHFQGDRTKQFERWYERQSKRLNAYGNTIPSSQVYLEFQRIRSQEFFEQKGKWFNYGPLTVGSRNNGDRRDGGRVKHIAFHPIDTATFYVSCFKSGLFRTRDGGLHWTPVTDHLPQEVFITAVMTADPNIIYIGTDAGVMVSKDEGISWERTGLSSGKIKALHIDPSDEQIIIVGNESGIYRSLNGGNSFVLVQSASKVEELKGHPSDPNILYAGTNGSSSQFFRSEDRGETWSELTNQFGQGAFMKIAVTPALPDNVYVINSRDHLGDDSFEGVYRSTDKGLTFDKISGQLPCITGYNSRAGSLSRGQPNYNLFIVVDPENPNTIYAGGVKSWKSVNGGLSWTQSFDNVTTLGFGLHLDQLSWAYSPHNNRLFAVNDGGIYFLNDDHLFQPIMDGLPIAEVWECTQSQINPTNVAGGTFHCGVKLNRNGIWYTPWGGDEATCLFDYSDDQYVYHFKYDKISRSTDGGYSFSRINPNPSDRGYYTGTGLLDQSDVNILYVGLFEVERSMNARALDPRDVTWEKVSSFGGTLRIEKIEQSTADHNILYVSREGNTFYRSENIRSNDPQFSNITEHLPVTGRVTDIATHPKDKNIVYILLGSRIYKSTDKGMSWTNISAGLPDIGLLEMVYDKSSDEGIYIGTDLGVYYKDAFMDEWIDYSNGLPAIRVSGMDVYYGDSRDESFLTISTDGRGFWRSLLHGVDPINPEIDFLANKTNVYTDEEVSFSDLSLDVHVGSFRWDFEGGTPAFSLEKRPIVQYAKPGQYPVSLTYTTGGGEVSKIKDNYIDVQKLPLPAANFVAQNTEVGKGSYVQFNDLSENLPASWDWTFEGGIPAKSSVQNPVVQYLEEGTFSVTLKATNNSGSSSKTTENYITVVPDVGAGSLQARYNFEGDLEDASSYNRDLFVQGDFHPEYSTAPDNGSMLSYKTPGVSNNYLFSGYKGIGGRDSRTVTAWFKTTPVGSRKTIISWGINEQGKMWNVMIDQGKVRIEGGTCNLQTKDSGLHDNQWHHVAVVYDPSFGSKMKDIKVYIDGELDKNESDGGASFRSEVVEVNTDNKINDLRVGSTEYNGNYYWRGEIDDIQVYNKALEASDIFTIFSNGTTFIEQTQRKSNLKVFPTLVSDTFQVAYVVERESEIKIMDLSGKPYLSKKLKVGSANISVNVSDLPSGIYIILLESDHSRVSKKITKI